MEINSNTKTFTKEVNLLLEKGVVGSLAEIADSLKWSRPSITSVMKGRRNVPRTIYRLFTEVYKIKTDPTDKDEIIALLRQNNKLLEGQLNLATGELRHISAMTFAILKTMRKSVAHILAKMGKEDILKVAGRLDKETSEYYKSIRKRGSLIDLDI